MAADYGIDVHLDRVPQREEDMEPWEIMISESQERMVAIVAPERLAEVEAVIDRWELHRAVIGEVTETGELRALWHDDVAGTIPARFLTEDCPRYAVEREPREPQRRGPAAARCRRPLPCCSSCSARTRSARGRSSRAATTSSSSRAPCAGRVSTQPCCACDRRTAASRSRSTARGASARSTRSRAALPRFSKQRATSPAPGGEPLGFTDCLNFGNPEKPEIGWELAESIEGMAQACEALSLPIVSGNVSLYNDTDGRSIHPTPVVGCVGLVPDVRRVPGTWKAGDAIMLASAGTPALPGLGAPGSLRHRLRLSAAARPRGPRRR